MKDDPDIFDLDQDYAGFSEQDDRDISALGRIVRKPRVSVRTNLTTKQIADQLELNAARQKVKKKAVKQRRVEFQRSRAMLILLLLDSGVDYVCVHHGCEIDEDLTVDHKIPLSRGGSDEVENLQFMCLTHNSSKGDNHPEGAEG